MKVSAGLVALSISSLREGDVESAAAFLSQAAAANDVSDLLYTLTDDNEFAFSLCSSLSSDTAELKTVVSSLSSELRRQEFEARLSDPLDGTSYSGEDDEDEDGEVSMDVLDFDDDEEDTQSTSSVSSPIEIKFR